MNIIKFQVEELLPALSAAVAVINPKNVIQILGDVKMETKKSGDGVCLVLTASDSETWVQTATSVDDSSTDGISICVEAKTLMQILSSLKGVCVIISVDESTHTLQVEYENGETKLPYEDSDEFPMPSALENEKTDIVVDSEKLMVGIKKTKNATSHDELRPITQGVFFDFSANSMCCVGTNFSQLVKYSDSSVKCFEDAQCGFTLHKKPCGILINLLSMFGEDDSRISFDTNLVSVANHRFKLTSKLLEGKYPPYEKVIPKEDGNVASVDRKMFTSVVKRVLSMGGDFRVTASFGSGKIVLTTQNVLFSTCAREECLCSYYGEDITVCLNGDILVSQLQNMESDIAEFHVYTSQTAVMLKEDKNTARCELVSLIMPMLQN